MSRNDEVAVIQRANGWWWVGIVSAENYHLYENERPQFSTLEAAFMAAKKKDREAGYTEYGINVYHYKK